VNDEARRVIDLLQLSPHPEGGFYRETFRSSAMVTLERGPRAAGTCIYFLLPAGTFSALHRVSSDEGWHHYAGDPLRIDLLDDGGRHLAVRLGDDVLAGDTPQHVVPAGAWQAATPLGDRYSLVGCTVAPGFDFADFEMPSRTELLARFPSHAALITSVTR
jgi:hypothetical protein